uniref:Uncharacterized protein n=1 Tax=Aegilops tauschii subsp. strangulata TaxID=200361 RepID=A0A453QIB2_AEGTS
MVILLYPGTTWPLQTRCSSWRPSSSRRSPRSVTLISLQDLQPINSFYAGILTLVCMSQAAATTCYAAVHPAVAGVSGRYFADCNEAAPSRLASSAEEASRLWSFSEAITAEKEKEESALPVTSFRFQVQSSNADRGMAIA